VRQVQDLEAPSQAFGQTPSHEQRRRAEQHHAQRQAVAGVLVPEPFDRLRPVGNLLHFVERKHGALLARVLRQQTSALPLRGQPGPIAQRRFVGGDEDAGAVELSQDLLHEGGLADLARSGHHVQKAPRLGQSGGQHCSVLTLKGGARCFTHCGEYFYSVRRAKARSHPPASGRPIARLAHGRSMVRGTVAASA